MISLVVIVTLMALLGAPIFVVISAFAMLGFYATDMPLALVLEGGYGPSHGAAVRHIFSALGGTRSGCGGPPVGKKTPGIISRLQRIHNLS